MSVASLAIGLLLWGIFFLDLQVLLVLALAAAVAITLFLAIRRQAVDTVAIVVAANFLCWLGSGLLVGAIGPRDLISTSFLNGDGRIFVAYLPLILFGFLDADQRALWTLQLHSAAIAAVAVILYVVWLLVHPAMLSEGGADNYVAFLTSHTGAGTFFGALSVFLILYGRESGRMILSITGWVTLLPLLGSGSRESMLAWLMVGAWYVLITRRIRFIFAMLLLAGVYIVTVPTLSPHLWERTGGLVTDLRLDGLWTATMKSQWQPGESDTGIEGKNQNITARLAFWKYGLTRFASSPLIGIGFGRCNDYDLRLVGLDGTAMVAVQGTKVLAPSSLHNSYFHVLCESGLVGFVLFAALWLMMYIRLGRARRRFARLADGRSLFLAAQGLIVFSLIAALTGHALAAPSLMIPVTTILGFAISYDRWLRSLVVVIPETANVGSSSAGSIARISSVRS